MNSKKQIVVSLVKGMKIKYGLTFNHILKRVKNFIMIYYKNLVNLN